jgi:hypothetical protein
LRYTILCVSLDRKLGVCNLCLFASYLYSCKVLLCHESSDTSNKSKVSASMKDDSDEIDALAALSSVSNSLSASFPLPFRILVLVSLGAFCWATNLHVLHLLGIDTAVVLDIRSLSSPNEHIHPSKLYTPVYQLAASLAAWTGLCWVVGFQVIGGGNGEAATGKAIAALSLFLAGILLFLPAERLKKSERMLLIRCVARV